MAHAWSLLRQKPRPAAPHPGRRAGTGRLRFAFLLLVAMPGPAAAEPGLKLLATWVSDMPEGTEILAYQAAVRMLAVGNGQAGQIDLVSVARPEQPATVRTFDFDTPGGHVLNSVAFHPEQPVLAVAAAGPPGVPGEILLLDLYGRRLARYAAGYGPDDVQFSPSGRWLATPNEAEGYWREGGAWRSHPGSVTLVDLQAGVAQGVVHQVAFAPPPPGHGLTLRGAGRLLEREVDGEEVEIPFDSGDPAHLEPEYVAFAPDESVLYVSLQENNGVAVIDLERAAVRGFIALGVAEHEADLEDDGEVSFTDTLRAFREPDRIAVTADGKYLVTADEGDTKPKASKTAGGPAGGGRTVSVVDLASGQVVGDTGNQLDAAAHAAGVYPDGRSDNKGSEPEAVAVFEAEGGAWALAGLERADALALIDLREPAEPAVRALVSLRRRGDASLAPEGLAYFEQDGMRYAATANEKSGTVSIVEIRF